MTYSICEDIVARPFIPVWRGLHAARTLTAFSLILSRITGHHPQGEQVDGNTEEDPSCHSPPSISLAVVLQCSHTPLEVQRPVSLHYTVIDTQCYRPVVPRPTECVCQLGCSMRQMAPSGYGALLWLANQWISWFKQKVGMECYSCTNNTPTAILVSLLHGQLHTHWLSTQ